MHSRFSNLFCWLTLASTYLCTFCTIVFNYSEMGRACIVRNSLYIMIEDNLCKLKPHWQTKSLEVGRLDDVLIASTVPHRHNRHDIGMSQDLYKGFPNISWGSFSWFLCGVSTLCNKACKD